MSELAVSLSLDRELYSLHEEEEVVEIPLHRQQVVYLETSLPPLLPDHYVAANMGVYWVPGQFQEPWTGPDLFVAARPPKEPQRVWVTFEDGPLLFVAEVTSDKTRRQERPKREERYRKALAVPEYLYIDLERRQLELWRLRSGEYRAVRAVKSRLPSQQLGVSFGWEPGAVFVRIWDAEGRMVPTRLEEQRQLREAEERAAAEFRQRLVERRLREEAEQARQEAEQARQEAEARAAALAAELERLRRGE